MADHSSSGDVLPGGFWQAVDPPLLTRCCGLQKMALGLLAQETVYSGGHLGLRVQPLAETRYKHATASHVASREAIVEDGPAPVKPAHQQVEVASKACCRKPAPVWSHGFPTPGDGRS